MPKNIFRMLTKRNSKKTFDAQRIGSRGEKLTVRKLNIVRLFGRKGRILRNLYVPKYNGETTEIDILFITKKGIFVIESKNYSGWIFGDEKSLNWTAALSANEGNSFYNPVKQNWTHMKWLLKYIDEDVPLFSLIVFSERCELKKIVIESPNVSVIKRGELQSTIKSIWNESADALDANMLNIIYKKLKPLTKPGRAVKEEHVKNIQEKYQNPKQASSFETKQFNGFHSQAGRKSEPNEINPIPCTQAPEKAVHPAQPALCPLCGAKLVLRTAQKGKNAGAQFYGCENFPNCRHTQNIDA